MNTLLPFLLVSLCGITNALHLPVVARAAPPVKRHMMTGGQPAVHMQQVQIPFTQNVENARDVVVSRYVSER